MALKKHPDMAGLKCLTKKVYKPIIAGKGECDNDYYKKRI